MCSLVVMESRIQIVWVFVQDLGSSSAEFIGQFDTRNASLKPFVVPVNIFTSLTAQTDPKGVLHINRVGFARLNAFFVHMSPNRRVMFNSTTRAPTILLQLRFGHSNETYVSRATQKPSLDGQIFLVLALTFARTPICSLDRPF